MPFVAPFCALALALSGMSAPRAQGQAPVDSKQKLLADAMLIGNLRPEDFVRPSLRATNPTCLPLADRAITRPLEAEDEILALHRKALKESASSLLNISRQQVFGDTPDADKLETTKAPTLPPSIPQPLRAPVGELIQAIGDANAAIRKALSPLSEKEKRLLIDSLPAYAMQGADVKFDFVKQEPAEEGELLKLVGKIDLTLLRAAGNKLCRRVESAKDTLEKVPASAIGPTIRETVNGIPIELSGGGDDAHTSRNTMLCIDLGGKNHYTGRYGAGVGYASVLIDLGESSFEGPDLNLGAGVTGIGIACLAGHNQTIRANAICMGAGLAGVGVFMHSGTSTDFASSNLSQGYGLFGIGLMSSSASKVSRCEAFRFSQGSAGAQGLGWMVCPNHSAGADLRLQSSDQSQGYGIGGAGLLTISALATTDICGRECQGSGEANGLGGAYWTGERGYFDSATQSFGSGEDSGAGYAIFEGRATLVFGAASCGHGSRGAIGFLRGLPGLLNPLRLIGPAGTAVGSGELDGIGIALLEANENLVASSTGHGRVGGIGIFAGSSDSSSSIEPAENRANVLGETGIALFHEGQAMPYQAQPKPPIPVKPTARDFKRALYASRIPGGRDTVAGSGSPTLADFGLPALQWAIDQCLANSSARDLVTIGALAKSLGEDGAKMLAAASRSADDAVVAGALQAANEGEVPLPADAVLAALKKPAAQTAAARAAGRLKLSDAVPDLMLLAAGEDAAVAPAAIRALAEIADLRSISTGQALLGSSQRRIRLAAEDLVAKAPPQAIDSAKSLLQRGEELPRRTALELLGKTGTPEALELIGPYLRDPNPGVKISALLALDGRCPVSFRKDFLDLQRDQNPLVKAVAARVDIGR